MATLMAVRPRPDQEHLPLQQAAEWYEVNESTLYRLMAHGELTRHRRRGDKRTWLATQQLEELFRPKPVDEPPSPS
jgi:hypothetical protein